MTGDRRIISSAMVRLISLLVIAAIHLLGPAADTAASGDLHGDVPVRSTPQKIQEAWLRFHESGLCQEVDSAFDFGGNRVEVWFRAGTAGGEIKFRTLFEPLRSALGMEIYGVRVQDAREPGSENDPPPSLWQNFELRSNLGDRAARGLRYLDFEEAALLDPGLADSFLKQRLRIYAEQTMDRNRKMERYAQDLHALTRMAFDPGIAQGTRAKAAGVGLAHARSLEKLIAKLIANLSLAIPASGRGGNVARHPPALQVAGKAPVEGARQISSNARDVARRVYKFIYPEDYTVGVDDLRNPSLLESLKMLQEAVREIQKSLGRATWK